MSASGQGWRERVAGQVVIVTGGGGVIGRAICEAFGHAGALVAVADLDAERLTQTVTIVDQPCGWSWADSCR